MTLWICYVGDSIGRITARAKDIINACYANYYTNSGVHDFNVSSSVRAPIFAQNPKTAVVHQRPQERPNRKTPTVDLAAVID